MTEKWSVVAHAKADLGVGEIARRLFSLLLASGMTVEMVGLDSSKSRQGALVHQNLPQFRSSPNVVTCVNPDQIAMVIASQKLYRREIRNHIGFWAWELEDFPAAFNSAFGLVNEVWTFSSFVRKAIQKSTELRVRALPMPIPVPARPAQFRRGDFGLRDESFLVVCSFDYLSDFRRKNPTGAILAYMEAFESQDHATLLIKSINSNYFLEEHSQLKELVSARKDVVFVDEYYAADKNLALLELADAVLSLHRSEGYGINLADAMARGTPVVATAYSGNLDFMNEDNSILIPYSLAPVARYANVKVDSFWAEPDIDAAARALRELSGNRKRAATLGSVSRQSIERDHSLEVSVRKFLEENLAG